jgi:hypothetical protein
MALRKRTEPRGTLGSSFSARQSEVAALVDQYGDVALSNFAQQMAELDPPRRRALQRQACKG